MQTDPRDAEILDLARAAGGGEALARFHSLHGRRLAAACRRLAGSASDGEDLYQDVLLQVGRSLAGFRGDAGLYTWAFRIAVHVALNRRRGLAAKAAHTTLEAAAGGMVAGAAEGGDPDFDCVASFRAWVVERALLALPEKQRVALTLCDLEEMTAAETGALLGIDANAVKQRVFRARRILRDTIAREFARRGVELDGAGVTGCVSGLFRDDTVAAVAYLRTPSSV